MYSNFFLKNIESVSGLVEILFDVYKDSRGSLYTTFLSKEYRDVGFPYDFVHDKFAFNPQIGTLRGIHGDDKSWKLVTVLYGSAHQVIVDNRIDSPTFGGLHECKLCAKEPKGFLIPPGCGNGFQTLEDNTLYHYKLSYDGQYNDAENQFTIPWNSKKFQINWPIPNPILSSRDKNAHD
jgi:dTDP-4-dehydrorhamnose 3,5-epimerase